MKRRMLIPLILLVTIFLTLEFINIFGVVASILTLAFVDLFLYYRKEIDFKKDLEVKSEKEKLEEEKRKKQFPEKFPKISKIPVLNWVTKWMYKEGWNYSVVLILLIIIGFILRIWNLGELSFWGDEVLTTTASYNFITKGTFMLPSGLPYERSILNLFFVSSSIKLFGLNEFAARFPSVIFGTLSLPLMYFFCKNILHNKKIGLLACMIIAFNAFEIVISRQARMYSQFQFFLILTFYSFYEGFENENEKMKYIFFLSLLSLLLSYIIGGVVLISLCFYILLRGKDWIKEKIFKKDIIIPAFILILILAFYMGRIYGFNNVKSYVLKDYIPNPLQLGERTFYIRYLSENYPLISSSALLIIPIFLLNKKTKYSYLLVIGIVSLFSISIILTWKAVRYLTLVFPQLIIYFSMFLFLLFLVMNKNFITTKKMYFKKISKTKIELIFASIVLFLCFLSLSARYENIYTYEDNEIGEVIYDHKDISEYIADRTNFEDCIVVTTNEVIGVYYFTWKKGFKVYFLRSIFIDPFVDKKNSKYTTWGGSEIISDIEKFKKVTLEHKSSWVVIEKGREKLIDKEIVEYIYENYKLIEYTDEEENVYIYYFENK